MALNLLLKYHSFLSRFFFIKVFLKGFIKGIKDIDYIIDFQRGVLKLGHIYIYYNRTI